jgi:hypothetical protein
LDSILQFPSLLVRFIPYFPISIFSSSSSWLFAYPCSQTGILTFIVEFYVPLLVLQLINGHNSFGCLQFTAAIACRSFALIASNSSNSFLSVMSNIACVCWLFALFVPSSLIHRVNKVIKKVLNELLRLSMIVFTFIEQLIFPLIISVCRKFLRHPLVLKTYLRLIEPLWIRISPLVVPLCIGYLSWSNAASLIHSFNNFHSNFVHLNFDFLLTMIANFICFLSSAVYFIILLFHAISRALRLESCARLIRPISRPLYYILYVCSSPLRLLLRLPFGGVFNKFITIMEKLTNFCLTEPILAIPTFILFNLFLLILANYYHFTDYLMNFINLILSYFSMSLEQFQTPIHHFNLVDSTLTLLIFSIVQSWTAKHAQSLLQTLINVDTTSSFNASGDELSMLASTMSDPRMCARCFYGPVDKTGCDNLSTHHNSYGNSNACPRCHWFASNFNSWPVFDSSIYSQSGSAERIFRTRIISDLVLSVRSAAKSLLIPSIILHVSLAYLNFSVSFSSFLALSYILPWVIESQQTWSATYAPNDFIPARRNRRRRRRNQINQIPLNDNESPDCGASSRSLPSTEFVSLTESEAMQILISTVPSICFLSEGTICPICLDEFSSELINSSASVADTTKVCKSLQVASPPCLALRCGHVLHLECVASTVNSALQSSSSAARHLRCPLCREPLTHGGATSARLFT